MRRRVDLVWTDVSEERIVSIFKDENGGDTFSETPVHKVYTTSRPRRRHSSTGIRFFFRFISVDPFHQSVRLVPKYIQLYYKYSQSHLSFRFSVLWQLAVLQVDTSVSEEEE
jgi:hypothetical protein